MIDTCNSLSPIFLSFTTNNFRDYFDELFSLVDEKSVITRPSNKKLKVPFRKTKLGIQNLSYAGPNTWNSFPGNFKSATSFNSFKHYIKEYLLKKFGNVEADIHRYT